MQGGGGGYPVIRDKKLVETQGRINNTYQMSGNTTGDRSRMDDMADGSEYSQLMVNQSSQDLLKPIQCDQNDFITSNVPELPEHTGLKKAAFAVANQTLGR